MRATLFSNIAVCFIKEEDYAYAKKYCKKVLGEVRMGLFLGRKPSEGQNESGQVL